MNFGTTFPVRITCQRVSDNAIVIFFVNSRNNDDLTISGAIEGTTDIALSPGDACEMRWTAGAIQELQTNLLYSTASPTNPTLGGIPAGTVYNSAFLLNVVDQLLHGPTPSSAGLSILDTFNDADNTALTSHTMDSGPSWQAIAGTATILSNQAKGLALGGPYGEIIQCVDSGRHEVTVSCQVANVTLSTANGLILRTMDASNYWMCNITGIPNNVRLNIWERTGGTLTNRAYVSIPSGGQPITNGDTITFSASGTTLTALHVRTGLSVSYSSSVRQTATLCGWSGNASSYLTNFQVNTYIGNYPSPAGTYLAPNIVVDTLGRIITAVNSIQAQICNGRLSLSSTNPASYSDLTGNTVYLVPYLGNRIGLFDGTNWNTYSFSAASPPSVPIPGALFSIYDVFAKYTGGAVTLYATNWAASQQTAAINNVNNALPGVVTTNAAHGFNNNDYIGLSGMSGGSANAMGNFYVIGGVAATTFQLTGNYPGAASTGGTAYKIPISRNVALQLQDGVWVNSADVTQRYLGTVATLGNTYIADTNVNRNVFNYYNRVQRGLLYDTPSGLTPWGINMWREWNDNMRVTALCGAGEGHPAIMNAAILVNVPSSDVVCVSIGYDSPNAAQLDAGLGRFDFFAAAANYNIHTNTNLGMGAIGLHYFPLQIYQNQAIATNWYQGRIWGTYVC